MAQGKYSPCWKKRDLSEYKYNVYGKAPAPYNRDAWNEKTMFDGYDEEGLDPYGYSAFGANGEYVGFGNGVDKNGYTEYDYLVMDPEDFANI